MHYQLKVWLRPGVLATSYTYENPHPYDYKKIFVFDTLEEAFEAREAIQRATWGRFWPEDYEWLKKNITTTDYPVRLDNTIYEVP